MLFFLHRWKSTNRLYYYRTLLLQDMNIYVDVCVCSCPSILVKTYFAP